MDYTTAARNFNFVGKLTMLSDTHPLGAASAFCAMHERLVSVVSHLGGDLGVEMVEKVAKLRKKVGTSVNELYRARCERLHLEQDPDELRKENYEAKLRVYRLEQDPEYFKQRGYVASQLLEGLKPEPFKDENDLTLEQLSWIIPSLTEARPSFSLDPVTEEYAMYTPELKEAYTLKLALSGIPDEKSELKFFSIQEMTLARLMGYVPPSIMLGYWQSLTPKNETAQTFHMYVEQMLIAQPCQEVSETSYIEGGLNLLEALSETVVSASRDWETRVLCQQVTEYINTCCKQVQERIKLVMSHSRSDLSVWADSCSSVINCIRSNYEAAKTTEICKHFELNLMELSPYTENFNATSEKAYLVLASCRC